MFPGRKNREHRSLSSNIDTKVLEHVREFSQAHLDSSNPLRHQPLSVSHLYSLLQERDVQLRRLKKVQLEASIQRAQAILRSDAVSDMSEGELDSDFEGMDSLDLVEVKVLGLFLRRGLTLGYKCCE